MTINPSPLNGLRQIDQALAEAPIAIWFVLGIGWTTMVAGARQFWHYTVANKATIIDYLVLDKQVGALGSCPQ